MYASVSRFAFDDNDEEEKECRCAVQIQLIRKILNENEPSPHLYCKQVGLHFFPASTARCLLEPWFRELGFIVCYGAIILKLYRHLVEFRTRKAHRWVLRDVDLLKYLSSMIFAVVCYMSAFTASSMDLIQTAALEGLQEVQTNTCQQMKWEFVTQFSEILILAFGLHLAIASRNATTQFRVKRDFFRGC